MTKPKKELKIVSWNVNGLNAAMKKGFVESVHGLDADIIGIQETKLQPQKLTDKMEHIPGYESFWSFSTVKKGYSGVALYTRLKPTQIRDGIGIERFDQEGRIIEADFGNFLLYTVYFPNGQMSDERLAYKLDFYRDFFAYTQNRRKEGRSVIVMGDVNTAHNEIDLKNPKANAKTSGFLKIEREWLDRILAMGYVDTFRCLYPETVKYSWWTYRFKARERNAGWRIDYCLVSEDLINNQQVKSAFIDNDVFGSDHCPVGITLAVAP